MDRMLNVMTLLSIVLILLVLRSLRRAHIRVEYSVSWLGASATLLILSRWSGALRWLGETLGIEDAALALVFIVGCLFLVVLYRFSIVISNQGPAAFDSDFFAIFRSLPQLAYPFSSFDNVLFSFHECRRLFFI